MNNAVAKSMLAAVLLSIAGGSLQASTSQFRSPLMLERGPLSRTFLYPHEKLQDAWWYDYTPNDCHRCEWDVEAWVAGYTRSATQAFYKTPCDPNPCKSNKVTRCTRPLSQLWFGSDSFTGEQIFGGGELPDGSLPFDLTFLQWSHITPRFEYDETGVYLGVMAERTFGCDDCWFAGVRLNLPIKQIDILQNQNCRLFETLDDVTRLHPIDERAGAPNPDEFDFAFRLDFLSSLSVPAGSDPDPQHPDSQRSFPFVGYQNATSAQTFITSTNKEGTDGFAVSGPTSNDAKVYLIGTPVGNAPTYPYRIDPNATTATALPAAGVTSDGTVSYFQTDVNYAAGVGSSSAAQATQWVVPQVLLNGQNGTLNDFDQLAERADQILDVITPILQSIKAQGGIFSPVSFFANKCIGLCAAERIVGVGDLDLELYTGYDGACWFGDLELGFRFPTGKRAKEVNRIFYQPTGNNGHFEIRVGMDGGWQMCNWAAIRLDWSYWHAFNRTEQRAAPFLGQTVRNIGPCVDAKVSWNSFQFHADLNLFHPCNRDLGMMIGYELFSKSKDKVCLCAKTATNFLDAEQELSARVLEQGTKTLTNKIRGAVFHRWNYFELMLGASQVFSGRDAMKESEAFISVNVYF